MAAGHSTFAIKQSEISNAIRPSAGSDPVYDSVATKLMVSTMAISVANAKPPVNKCTHIKAAPRNKRYRREMCGRAQASRLETKYLQTWPKTPSPAQMVRIHKCTHAGHLRQSHIDY